MGKSEKQKEEGSRYGSVASTVMDMDSTKSRATQKSHRSTCSTTSTTTRSRRLVRDAHHIRNLLDKVSKEPGGFKDFLEKGYKKLNEEARFARTFRDGLEERERDKINIPGVLVYDRSRFKLSQGLTDFINASVVHTWDGRRIGYLLTQAPCLPQPHAQPNHQEDFWQMVYQAGVCTIAVLLPTIAFSACQPPVTAWWPLAAYKRITCGRFKVDAVAVVEGAEWTTYDLRLSRCSGGTPSAKNKEPRDRIVRLLHYEGWTKDKEPPPGLVRFLGRVHHFQVNGDRANGLAVPSQSPLVFVCPSGIQRCGLFGALAMAMSMYQSTFQVNLPAVVHRVQGERWGAVAKSWEYLWLHKRMAEYFLTNDFIMHKERLELGPKVAATASELDPEDPGAYGGPVLFHGY